MQTSQQLNKPKTRRRASLGQRLVAATIFLGSTAFFGGFALANHYKIPIWPFGCGFRQKYDLPCPTCGFTTAVIAFIRGKIFEAFYLQPAAAFLCCVLAASLLLALFIAVSGIYFDFINRIFNKSNVKYIILALIIIVTAGWTVILARALAAKGQG